MMTERPITLKDPLSGMLRSKTLTSVCADLRQKTLVSAVRACACASHWHLHTRSSTSRATCDPIAADRDGAEIAGAPVVVGPFSADGVKHRPAAVGGHVAHVPQLHARVRTHAGGGSGRAPLARRAAAGRGAGLGCTMCTRRPCCPGGSPRIVPAIAVPAEGRRGAGSGPGRARPTGQRRRGEEGQVGS